MSEREEPYGLLSDFRLLLYLFIGFRVALALVYQPYVFELYEKDGSPTTVERGMSTFGDLRYYYPFAQLSEERLWPYRDYWHEFPPVWISLFTFVYGVMKTRGAVDYTGWATALGLILLVFDIGNLILLRRLARWLHGEQAANTLPWIYVVLAAPVIFPWWTFETIVVFFILLALLGLLQGRHTVSAGVIALGTLTKYTPILILPAVWRFYDRRRAIHYTLITLLIVGLVLCGLVAWGGRMAVGSLLAQFNKASYQSVWALIDGNLRTGAFPGLETRFDADNAFKPYGHDPVIPAWLRLIPFVAVGLFIFSRKIRQDDRGLLAFFTLTVILFFLWAQGWSPQWVLTLTPLILLNFPNREGALFCLVLGLTSFVEYPVLFMRTGDSGTITGALVLPYALLVLLRTLILSVLGVMLYQSLTGDEKH